MADRFPDRPGARSHSAVSSSAHYQVSNLVYVLDVLLRDTHADTVSVFDFVVSFLLVSSHTSVEIRRGQADNICEVLAT